MMISYDTKNVEMPALVFPLTDLWLKNVAESHQKKIGRLNYLFCDDEEILRVNREFLNHDYFTDIITFDYSYKDKVNGDIFISLDTVKSNSEELNVPYKTELLRVLVHGLLHLCGINDKEPGEREIMEENENKALRLWEEMKNEI